MHQYRRRLLPADYYRSVNYNNMLIIQMAKKWNIHAAFFLFDSLVLFSLLSASFVSPGLLASNKQTRTPGVLPTHILSHATSIGMSSYNEVTPKKLGKKNKSRGNKPAPNGVIPQANENNNAGWPDSLSEFVNKLFDRVSSLSPEIQAQFPSQIQALMELAIAQNKVWSNPWQYQNLPVFDPSCPLDLYENIHKNSVPLPEQDLPLHNELSSKSTHTKRKSAFDSKERKRQRMDRFASPTSDRPSTPPPSNPDGPVIGYLSALEKRYLRLTSAPDPALVRPEKMLRKCLDFVCKKYKETKAGYLYINDQLKAIRQDLTVQHIKNDLAITVYETHGRIAILNDDLGEFNQCLSQLKHLYAENKGAGEWHETYEFTCYRIIYFTITGNYAEVNKINLELLTSDKSGDDVPEKFKEITDCMYKSLDILTFIVQGDYHGFFEVLRQIRKVEAMKCASHLIDQFMTTKQRLLAIDTMCQAFKKLPKEYLSTELGIEDGPDTETIDIFCQNHNLSQFIVGSDFDCAMAKATIRTIVQKGNFKKVDIKGQK